jgi:hypothetical protein
MACIELFLIFRGKTPPKNSPHSLKRESCAQFFVRSNRGQRKNIKNTVICYLFKKIALMTR